jgi:hypothetical protein
MANYKSGEYLKAGFKDDTTRESEWMWVKVSLNESASGPDKSDAVEAGRI